MYFHPVAVCLSINGKAISSGGYLPASDIGRGDTGLHCNTDRNDCCRTFGEGHWYLPNGNEVMSFTAEDNARPEPDNFFSRDRVTGIVRLNRNGNPPDRGHFHCVIPNAGGNNVTLDVNIGKAYSNLLHDMVANVIKAVYVNYYRYYSASP